MGQEPKKGEGQSAGRKTKPPIPPGWKREGGGDASGVEQNIEGGNSQRTGGGIESPGDTKTSGVKGMPGGDETPGVNPEGDRVPGRDGPRRGGDENSPAIQAAAGARPKHKEKSERNRPGPVTQLCHQRERTAGRNGGIDDREQASMQ